MFDFRDQETCTADIIFMFRDQNTCISGWLNVIETVNQTSSLILILCQSLGKFLGFC